MLLSKAWTLFEADKRIEGFSPQTLKAYRLQSFLLIGYFKDIEMELLDTSQLKEYLVISGQTLKTSPSCTSYRFMKSFFRWSHEEGYLSKNPTSKIKEPKVGKRIPKYLTELEIEHLRGSCHSAMEKVIFEFMFSTGCRIGEIVALEKNHINWSNQSAIVRGKGDKEREVYFTRVVTYGLNVILKAVLTIILPSL